MEKIAIISDVHGNLTALKRVLEDINKRKIKIIYCLGDTIGKGMNSNKCLDLLKNTKMVYGNWEDYFNNKICKDEHTLKRYELLKKELSKENQDRLKKLPLVIEIYISGRLVRMFHATPKSAWDGLLGTDKIEQLYSQFLPTENTSNKKADIVIYGHTHMQNMLKMYNRTLVNAGSVGNSFDIIRDEEKDGNIKNTTSANYLTIEGELDSKEHSDIYIEFVSLDYDIKKELEFNKNNIELEEYTKELLTGKYRNKIKTKF